MIVLYFRLLMLDGDLTLGSLMDLGAWVDLKSLRVNPLTRQT